MNESFTVKRFKIFLFICFLTYGVFFLKGISQIKHIIFDLRWQAEIQVLGPQAAYAHFKEEAQPESYVLQHLDAHSFGKLLYRIYGLDVLSFCDDSFGYGCYHILIGTAIAEKGPDVVKKIVANCDSLSYVSDQKSCKHGVGHGLLLTLDMEVPELISQ